MIEFGLYFVNETLMSQSQVLWGNKFTIMIFLLQSLCACRCFGARLYDGINCKSKLVTHIDSLWGVVFHNRMVVRAQKCRFKNSHSTKKNMYFCFTYCLLRKRKVELFENLRLNYNSIIKSDTVEVCTKINVMIRYRYSQSVRYPLMSGVVPEENVPLSSNFSLP